jgi:hypothetical protein
MKYKLSILFFIALSLETFAQTFYDLNTIQTIEITFSQSNWDALLDAAEANDAYIPAQSVSFNGTVLTNIGVKYKGNSSYNANQVKNPIHIELDAYVNQNYQGYTDIKLSNVYKDPSFVREALAYKMLKNYMHAPLANYAKLYINGSYIGLYTNVESVSKKFVNSHFGSNSNAFFDCSPPAGAGPGVTNLPNLSYLGTNFTSYESAYEMKSTTGWDDLIALTNTLNNNTNSIETVLDVDRALWMLAFDNLLVNLDSYIGAFKQNYYIYKDNNGRFNPVIWDLNESFGTFANTGSSNLNTTTQKAQMSHTLHSTETAWPLVQKLLAIPTYKKRYLAHYKTILNEMIVSGLYLTDAQAIQALISASVTADTNKFSYQSNIATNLTTDVSLGMGSASGLSALMNSRKTYLQAQTDFTNTQPSITSINPSNSNPPIGSNVTITANVTNTNTDAVYLGYRSTTDAIFTKVLMYDDGNHNDGSAGDNVYGASITVSSIALQYYIYAENNNIGKFSPERAEHEFYTINATYPTINAGDLVINEIMAQNTSTITDADGEYEDWFELYNNSSNTLSLDNLYATDTSSNMLKWQFPSGLTIEPNSYLVVWADQDLTQTGIHADFKFSAAGEKCILSYPDGTVVDTVTFGAQTTDMGYARIPNGTGNFVIQAPTFNANNESLGINQYSVSDIKFFPNPVDTMLNINAPFLIDEVKVFSSLGQLLLSEKYNLNNISLDLSSFEQGVYLMKINNTFSKIILKK